jgi:hypothetical protein
MVQRSISRHLLQVYDPALAGARLTKHDDLLVYWYSQLADGSSIAGRGPGNVFSGFDYAPYRRSQH